MINHNDDDNENEGDDDNEDAGDEDGAVESVAGQWRVSIH